MEQPAHKIKTPSLSHFTSSDYDEVYEPAEDSFLFLDALELEAPQLEWSKLCVEIGAGSGVITAGLASVLQGCAFLATDLNGKAADKAKETAKENGVEVEVVRGDLLAGLEQRLEGKIDVLVKGVDYAL